MFAGHAGDGQNLHSLNIDFNFKVPHLKNADSRPLGEQEEAPSFRKRFIPDSEAISFLELAPELAAEPEPAEKSCSDFSAAQVSFETIQRRFSADHCALAVYIRLLCCAFNHHSVSSPPHSSCPPFPCQAHDPQSTGGCHSSIMQY